MADLDPLALEAACEAHAEAVWELARRDGGLDASWEWVKQENPDMANSIRRVAREGTTAAIRAYLDATEGRNQS